MSNHAHYLLALLTIVVSLYGLRWCFRRMYCGSARDARRTLKRLRRNL